MIKTLKCKGYRINLLNVVEYAQLCTNKYKHSWSSPSWTIAFGNYDGNEEFAFKPNEIYWRFRLYPTPEIDSPTWAAGFDEITAEMIM
ncbi:hypothetical protein D4T97_005200 [Siminovitchia acidinfaciens]|uniref:Uncharacterized protein n=1 Tax=Siminovitchia acidinfaciens TaxID=2321395 RepID=A0A429Y455_9BACI|nr:hypothetical protein D4T97_005200 [Siminovitchia acidinfaciens]